MVNKFGHPYCIAPNGRTIEELGKIWKEEVMG
jgi:hypothetical protein